MTSEDVLHSFFIPNFRIKQDVVPGMYTSVWFEATVPGKHQIYCTEYCGTSHSGMLAKAIVLDEQKWKDWLAGKEVGPQPMAGEEMSDSDRRTGTQPGGETKLAASSLPEQGKTLYEQKGCVACHTVDGTTRIGPTFKGLYGHSVELSDGQKVTADENYLRESIENPNAKLVKGFTPQMPTFKGLISEKELAALIAYIKSVKD